MSAESCQQKMLSNSAIINVRLLTAFHTLRKDPDTEHSHHFAGRFENIYIKRSRIPEMEPVLDIALRQASGWMGKPESAFRIGFWFNLMEPGHVTLPHDHVEDNELLSCTYYIKVPVNSGDLLLGEPHEQRVITPKEGMMVLFSPDLVHEVSENRSSESRLSVAMNIGPVAPDE